MNHSDHIRLLKKANIRDGNWGDFGSGTGAFTLALRDLGGPDLRIFSVDKDSSALATQKQLFNKRFPESNIFYIQEDFTERLLLPQLDGIILVNSLHFVKDKKSTMQKFKDYLNPNGTIVLIEYNVDKVNIWVPFPLSFKTFQSLTLEIGFSQPVLMETIPSEFLDEIYSAKTSMLE